MSHSSVTAMDTESEDDQTDSAKKQKTKKDGIPVTRYNRPAMRMMHISKVISSLQTYDEALPLFQTKLKRGQAYSLFMLVRHGNNMPVELHTVDMARKVIFASAAAFALGPEEISHFEK